MDKGLWKGVCTDPVHAEGRLGALREARMEDVWPEESNTDGFGTQSITTFLKRNNEIRDSTMQSRHKVKSNIS
jgi:hypothetical protein